MNMRLFLLFLTAVLPGCALTPARETKTPTPGGQPKVERPSLGVDLGEDAGKILVRTSPTKKRVTVQWRLIF